MADDKKTLKFQMMMSPTEAEVLDDWMFANRVRSRAEAIRRLTQIALAIEPIIEDVQKISRRIALADGKIGASVIDAIGDIDSLDRKEFLDRISKAHDALTGPALDLALQGAKIDAIVSALKNGADVEKALTAVEESIQAFDGTREFVLSRWRDKD